MFCEYVCMCVHTCITLLFASIRHVNFDNVHSLQVGTDFLEEEITKFEDLIQSVDIAAFNKI